MINIAIVEDSRSDAELLWQCLKRYSSEKTLELKYAWIPSAHEFLDSYRGQYDIIFFDIKMPGINGMEAAHRIRKMDSTVVIIFLTSLTQYAIKGYEVEALDYIIKPVSYAALTMKLQRAISHVSRKKDSTVVIHTKNSVVRLNASQVKYIEIYDHHIMYKTTEGKYNAYGTLKQVSQDLPGSGFFRCNNQSIVNMQYVEMIDGDSITVDDRVFTISRLRKKEFMEQMHRFLGVN